MSNRTLKEQNVWLLRGFILVVGLLFLGFCYGNPIFDVSSFDSTTGRLSEIITPTGLGLIVLSITKLWLLGMLPPSTRDKIVHWRFRHPLPGSRAFSKIAPNDPRIDLVKLTTDYGTLPEDPIEQGRLFYGIYKSVDGASGVDDAHRSYLAARDCSSMAFILLFVLTPLVFIVSTGVEPAVTFAGIMIVSFLLLSFAAQTYSLRFVQNVLAEASTS